MEGSATQTAEAPIIKCGGLSEEMTTDSHVQYFCDVVKPEFLKKSKVNAEEFKAVTYATQVVNGIMYFVKVCIGGNQYCVLKIHVPPLVTEEETKLSGFQLDKKEGDHIIYF